MDAIEFLLSEHRKFRKVLQTIARADQTEYMRMKVFTKLVRDLSVHEEMEQKTWYPQIRSYLPNNRILPHLIQEEKDASKLIRQLKATRSDDEWWNLFRKFRRAVLHHAREEETSLFPLARRRVPQGFLLELGRDMRTFKRSHS